MDYSVLSIDSLGESELDLLRDKLKQKDQIINEKSQIIDSLRQQVKDLNQDNEELENSQQFLQQKVDRLAKELGEKDYELESLSHSLKEVEMAHEKLERRMEARTGQVQKFAEDLVHAKKELEEAKTLNEALQHKNEKLSTELEMANSRKRSLQELRQEENVCKPRAQKFSTALRFPIADEIGEFMDTSSHLSVAQSKPCQYHISAQQENLDWPVGASNKFGTVKKEVPYRREPTFEEEHAMRVARAQELARRNAKTKPLHQTSYALELDTFDTDFTEQEIKRGNIRPPQRPPPQPPVRPVVKRQVYKKAEAFIV